MRCFVGASVVKFWREIGGDFIPDAIFFFVVARSCKTMWAYPRLSIRPGLALKYNFVVNKSWTKLVHRCCIHLHTRESCEITQCKIIWDDCHDHVTKRKDHWSWSLELGVVNFEVNEDFPIIHVWASPSWSCSIFVVNRKSCGDHAAHPSPHHPK
jgi:hypothetical protein